MSGVESCSVDTHELNLEDKGGVGRDDVASTTLTIGVVGRAGKLGLLSNLELHDALIPAANNLLNTDLELERLTTVSAAIELGAVKQGANVVDGDLSSFGWAVARSLAWVVDFNFKAHLYV